MMTTSQRPGLKTGGKNIFWSEKGSGFGKSGGTPHQEEVPPGKKYAHEIC